MNEQNTSRELLRILLNDGLEAGVKLDFALHLPVI